MSGNDPGVRIRFECGQEDRFSQVYGPFEFAQLTYGILRVGPDGEDFGAYIDGWWHAPDGARYSDVVIFNALSES